MFVPVKLQRWGRRLVIAGITLTLALIVLSSDMLPPLFVVKSDQMIEGDPSMVWSILSDFDNYSDWNPYVTAISGSLQIGEPLQITLVEGNSKKSRSLRVIVSDATENSQFCWKGHVLFPGILDTRHCFAIQRDDSQNTMFTQYEEFRGLLSLVVVAFPNANEKTATLKATFDGMGLALDDHITSLRTQ